MKNSSFNMYAIALVFYAVIFALGSYPSIETHPGYYGMTYGIIHPESFSSDVVGNHTPAAFSLQTLLVQWGGELWLDERFVMCVWFLIVGLSLWGVDRLMTLMGVTSGWDKLVVLAIIMGYHKFVDNIPRVIDSACVRPTTLSGPIVIWLSVWLLQGRQWLTIWFLAFLSVAVSVKNSWIWWVMTSIHFCHDHLGWPVRRLWFFGASVFLLVLTLYGCWQMAQGGLSVNARLFDDLIAHTENSEANPLMDGLGPWAFLGFLLVSLRCQPPAPWPRRRWGFLVGVFAAIYVLGGLYYTFAPDILKMPLLAGFAVNRSTWWVQILIFMVLSAWALLRWNGPKTAVDWPAFLALTALFYFPLIDHVYWKQWLQGSFWKLDPLMAKKFILTTGAMVFCSGFYVLIRGRLPGVNWRHALLAPLIISMFFSAGKKLVEQKEALSFLMHYGILGNTPGAQWVGVNEYIRRSTPADSQILALTGNPLHLDSSLKIRTGRTMPHNYSSLALYFDLEKTIWARKYEERVAQLPQYWQFCDSAGMRMILGEMKWPQYIVLPRNHFCQADRVGYALDQTINGFNIWRRNKDR